MVLGIRSKSRKRVSIQVHYTIHVQEIKPWPPSQSLGSARSVLLQWENGDQNSGSLASTAGDGKIKFDESFRLSVLLWRAASNKGKHHENFQKNCLEFHLHDKTIKNQLLGSATINLADYGIIKETTAISTQVNCKRSFRNSAHPFLYVNIQPFDTECSSSSPNSTMSKELSLDKEESESVSQSVNDDDIEIASFTDDEDDDDDDDDDISSNTLQTSRSASETRDSIKISEGGTKESNGEFVLPLETTSSRFLGDAKGKASIKFNGIKSPSSSTFLLSGMGNAANCRPLPKFSEESVKAAETNSRIPESIEQSCVQNITKGHMVKSVSSASYNSLSMQLNNKRSSQSPVTQEDNMIEEDSRRDQRYNKDDPEKVSNVPDSGILKEKEKMEGEEKRHEQVTKKDKLVEIELVPNLSEDDSTRKGELNSATLLLSKKSYEHPTSVLISDKAEDVRTVKFPLHSAESFGLFNGSQAQDQAQEMNALNDVHVGAAYHAGINKNRSIPSNKAELKAEVEMLREELREAAALEVSLYSVIADHGNSANKVHAPARRLSRFYFHAYRVGSPAKRASAAQSAISGFVLVSKACGNDVPRLTFWFSNLILLRAIVSQGVEKIHLGDGSCINSEGDRNGPPPHKEEKENTEKYFDSWEDPKTFLVALEKVEAWIFSRIVESVWWQTMTPYMQSAAAKSSSSRKINGRRYGIGDQDQGNFSIDLWKRAFRDACERLCPVRAGGHACACLPVIARLVMEQLVNRLDVAMFNAILRESADEMPTDPISDPISDSKVLPIPSGKSSFGAGAQLKNAIGDWSRWLSDLFGIDDSDTREHSNENDGPDCESSFKAFHLLNALSDLMMLPSEMLADGTMRKEVCPIFGLSLIRRVVNNFVPDEFSPGPIPNAVLEALSDEDDQDDEGCITSFPCSAGFPFYATPAASSVVGMLQEVGTKTLLKSGSFVLKKLYTSDDELDELDSPLSSLGMDDSLLASKKTFTEVKGGRKVVRYELLREVWNSSA